MITKKKSAAFLFLASILLLICFIFTAVTAEALPEEIHVSDTSDIYFDPLPYVSVITEADETVFASSSESDAGFTAKAKIMGIIPIKDIDVKVVDEIRVIPCGTPFGIKINTKGVVVIGTGEVQTDKESLCPGEICGICPGDIIESVNGVDISTTNELIDFVGKSKGEAITVTVLRDGNRMSLSLTPVYSTTDNTYKIGLWVRDSSIGIGTLTYIDPKSGRFGGLGHAICDSSSGVILPVGSGIITDVNLTGVRKGVSGTPGELTGFLGDRSLGYLNSNGTTGVYGVYDMPYTDSQTVAAAMKQEVKEGKAYILTTLPGKKHAEYFDIEIEKINYDDDTPTRNMVIKVTDEKLIEITGGIVQGMSGSPIIQNGKLVGAVTHVLVNDPTRGYGIFIENMLKN